MRKAPISILAAIPVAWLAFGTGHAEETGTPKLVCAESRFDFGQVDNYREIEHTFVLTNEGNARLTIDRVRAGCGCLKAELGQKEVPPGGSTTLGVELCLTGRVGEQRFSTYVHSNDPQQPYFILQSVGFAREDVHVIPSKLQFGGTNPCCVLSATIVNRAGDPLHIVAVEASGAFFSARLTTNSPGQEYRVQVQLATNDMGAAAHGEVRLLTDRARQPRLVIPVSRGTQ